MADNLTTQSSTLATVPASSVISTEEITTLNAGAVSAQHIQRIAAAIRTADGTAVDLPGSTADGLLVNLGANNDVTVTSGTITLGAGTAGIGKLTANSGVVIGSVEIAAAQTLATVTTVGTVTTVTTVTTVGTVSSVSAVIPGTGATNLGKAVDSVAGATDTGVATVAVRVDTPTTLTPANGDYAALRVSSEGGLWVRSSNPSADFGIGSDNDTPSGVVTPVGFLVDDVSTGSVTEGKIAAGRVTSLRQQVVTPQPFTSGGLTTHHTVSAGSTNATVVKNAAGMLYEIYVSSVNAAARYLKLYNKATAPTVGSDTPLWTMVIPGNTAGGGFAKTIPMGLEFTAGISFALTTEATDAGTTGVSANEHVVNLGYK